MPKKQQGFEILDEIAQAEALAWLDENAPKYAAGVRQAVKAGHSPQDIYYHMIDTLGGHRKALAVRMRNAAAGLSK